MAGRLMAWTGVIAALVTGSSLAAQRGRTGSGPRRASEATEPQRVVDDRRTEAALAAVAAELRAMREQAAQEARERAARETRPGPPIYSNWVLILVTGGAVLVAFRTLGAIQQQVEANAVAADAAKKSADTAERMMYLSLRARVGLHSVDAQNFGAGQESSIHLRFENYGGKGALLLDYCIHSMIGPLPPTPNYDALGWTPIGTPLEARSRHTVMFRLMPPLGDAQWAAIADEAANARRFHLYGALRYRVGFGAETKTVGFCREYDPILSRLQNKPIFATHGGSTYNHAD